MRPTEMETWLWGVSAKMIRLSRHCSSFPDTVHHQGSAHVSSISERFFLRIQLRLSPGDPRIRIWRPHVVQVDQRSHRGHENVWRSTAWSRVLQLLFPPGATFFFFLGGDASHDIADFVRLCMAAGRGYPAIHT